MLPAVSVDNARFQDSGALQLHALVVSTCPENFGRRFGECFWGGLFSRFLFFQSWVGSMEMSDFLGDLEIWDVFFRSFWVVKTLVSIGGFATTLVHSG